MSNKPKPKRPPGRPKGTTNKLTAGAVGRPRKDGRPPQWKSVSISGEVMPVSDLAASSVTEGRSIVHDSGLPGTATGSGEVADCDDAQADDLPGPEQDEVLIGHAVDEDAVDGCIDAGHIDPPMGTLHSIMLASFGEPHGSTAAP